MKMSCVGTKVVIHGGRPAKASDSALISRETGLTN